VQVDVRKPGQVTLCDIKVYKTPAGNSLWLVFVDAATNHAVVELLTTKSSPNICEAVDQYLVKMGQFVHRGDFYSDSEATFLAKANIEHLIRNGQRPIVLEASPPYIQQLNGKVERIAGVINKMADCMDQQFVSQLGDLGETHLAKISLMAFKHAAEIFNRLSPARGGKSSNELLYSRVSPHNELRVFWKS